MLYKILVIFFMFTGISLCEPQNSSLPVVLWHGMGATCCFPSILRSIKKLIKNETGAVVKSLEIGGNLILDFQSGFFIHPDIQVDYVCKELVKDERLANGYNAIGFSQGGPFLRAVAQRCPHPPMKVLITIGAPHQGVFGLPHCPSLTVSSCEYIRKLLNYAAYDELLQKKLVQATYWHDPLHEDEYRLRGTFLSDINNELVVNDNYKKNLNSLEKFVMVKFLNDTTVVPRESQWFAYYTPGQDKEIRPLDLSPVYENLGLRQMAADGKLLFLDVIGDHLEISRDWFIELIIPLLRSKI